MYLKHWGEGRRRGWHILYPPSLQALVATMSGNSRSWEFPGMPASDSRPESREWNFPLPFPFSKKGMEFYGIFIPVPVPENWIGIFHLDSRSRKMGMEFAISHSRSRSPKVIPAHGWGKFKHSRTFSHLGKLNFWSVF